MASTRRAAEGIYGEGRVTRSQAAQLGGAAAAAEAVKTVCGSGGRRAAGAKKRAALCDLTNGSAAAARAAAARAKPVELDAPVDGDAPTGALTRRRAQSMDKPAVMALEALRPSAADTAVAMEVEAPGPGPGSAAAAPGGASCASAPSSSAWKDVDAAHADDPLFCCQYVSDIYRNLRAAEGKHRPSTRYMETVQVDINATMRGILVDWLVEVAEEYKLVPDTLFLSVAYIDRCLSAHVVQRAQLQLVGVTCMLIAAKYEEIYAPQVDEFCYITDNTYTREQVLAMERKVLDVLSFELTTPTTKSFLRRFLRAAEADHKAEFLACFLAELSLLDYAFLRFMPSCVAASCVLVSQWTLRRTPWSPTLAHYAGYQAPELRDCCTALVELFAGAKRATLPAVREKYSQHKFKCVSSLVPPEGGLPDCTWR